jgi:hypothetical protein
VALPEFDGNPIVGLVMDRVKEADSGWLTAFVITQDGDGTYLLHEVYFVDGRSPSIPEAFDDYDDALQRAIKLARFDY